MISSGNHLLIDMSGLAISLGASFQIAVKQTGTKSMEITVEQEIDTSFLPEQFKKYKLYARLIFNIHMLGRLPILHVPVYAPEKEHEIAEEAKVNWNKVVKVGSTIIAGVLSAIGLILLLGLVTPAIGTGVAAIYQIGVVIVQGILKWII